MVQPHKPDMALAALPIGPHQWAHEAGNRMGKRVCAFSGQRSFRRQSQVQHGAEERTLAQDHRAALID